MHHAVCAQRSDSDILTMTAMTAVAMMKVMMAIMVITMMTRLVLISEGACEKYFTTIAFTFVAQRHNYIDVGHI